SITINGRDALSMDPTELRRGIGYVIQQVGLFPHLSVADNVATVPRLLGWSKQRTRQRVNELLELVGLPVAQFAKRLPSELSGGQRQRVGVARALGGDPPILLLDEPFGAIDPVTRMRLQDELVRLQSVVLKTIVFVTHDIDEAVKLGDRIALFEHGGRLAQVATPAELLAHPASDFAASFVGEGRLVRRLGLIKLADVRLAPTVEPAPALSVDAAVTLREALDAVLRSPDGRVAVTEDGRLLGMVDSEVIRKAARPDAAPAEERS
ncbi:MAG TPA: ABC transporter ATP-binding protein, partial [Candidatus Dormibacteraeota bacterium]|nr:ABC transporter ATP-binding protein [Candidatus Dormibacteraeota bacterium]